MPIMFWLAIIISLALIALVIELAMGMRKMQTIKAIAPLEHSSSPSVSVIIPACNEALTIEPALASILALDYPNLEIIILNDRSTDDTGSVLSRMQQQHPQLKIFEIEHLPSGWLGKSHALQFGANKAQGEYLLFTDADIVMEQTTLSRALNHMLTQRLDHLSISFDSSAKDGLLNTLFIDVGSALMLLFKPWKAKDVHSKNYMGIGAFNLVKAAAYAAVGGHSSFATQPLEDLMLGKVLKSQGFKQDCLVGLDFVRVEWYCSTKEFIEGVMKNNFAVYNYSLFKVLLAVGAIFALYIFPVWALFFTSGVTFVVYSIAVILRIAPFAVGFVSHGQSAWRAMWSLVSPYVIIYITLKAALTTLWKQGITWRSTFYSLEELKQSKF